jgi:hypothetical protein
MAATLLGCSRENARRELAAEQAVQQEATAKFPAVLNGVWLRTEEYRDPGNGTGSWRTLPPAEQGTLILTSSGQVSARNYPRLEEFDHYTVEAPNRLNFYDNSGNSVSAYYSFSNEKQLQLDFVAREALRDRFMREK